MITIINDSLIVEALKKIANLNAEKTILGIPEGLFAFFSSLIVVAISFLLKWEYDRNKEIKRRSDFAEFIISSLKECIRLVNLQIQNFEEALNLDKEVKIRFIKHIQTQTIKSFLSIKQSDMYNSLVINKVGSVIEKGNALNKIIGSLGSTIELVQNSIEATYTFTERNRFFMAELDERLQEFRSFNDRMFFAVEVSTELKGFYSQITTIMNSVENKTDISTNIAMHQNFIDIYQKIFPKLVQARELGRISQSVIIAYQNVKNLSDALGSSHVDSLALCNKNKKDLSESLEYLEGIANKKVRKFFLLP